MKFEWDEPKRQSNLRKHGVDFRAALAAFADPARILEVVPGKSGGREPRYRCIGFDGAGVVTVNFTLRAGVVRLINAGYWRKGKKEYENRSTH